MTTHVPVVTIDGPGGSGKGTIANRVAVALGFQLLDSGALYRLTAYSAKKRGVAFDDVPGLQQVASSMSITFEPGEHNQPVQIILDGENVTKSIRLEETGSAASLVAPIPEVRKALFQRQRGFATPPGLVADGRDMGTVVFQDAPLKIFLTASAEERARRRVEQLQAKGEDVNIGEILTEIQERDKRDTERKVSPLKPADDSVVIDSSNMTIDEVEAQILALAQERGLTQ